MKNPFKFSGVVADRAFCNREKEQKELRQYIENGQNVLLYSHRRFGKTSLILKIFKGLRQATPVYVDLYGTTRVEEFVIAFLKGLSTVESKMERLIKVFREGVRSIGINFSVDPVTGLPTAVPVFSKAVEDRTIEEIFEVAENLSRKKRVVVAFDEFQEVAAYGGPAFEKRLRKAIQMHGNIGYIFAGSQRHLLTEMFRDKNRAFYLAAEGYPLGKIETIHYVRWIKGLYKNADRPIDDRLIEDVAGRCENHPMYVQAFFFHLWPEKDMSVEVLDRIERRLVEKRIPEYAYVWDTLTLNQKRALKLVAGTGGKNVFAAENLSQYGFRTGSQLTAALSHVEQLGAVEKNDHWTIHDPFFKRWLL
jgi:uncharacterized protein